MYLIINLKKFIMKVTLDPKQGQSLELKVDGKRLKSIQQACEAGNINGVATTVTNLKVVSAIEELEVKIPVAGFWKLVGDNRDSLKFFPREGCCCADFAILLV